MNTLFSVPSRLWAALAFCLVLAGCGGSESAIVTGTGPTGVTSDGGSASAGFAGTYVGTVTVVAKGSRIDTDTTRDAILTVRSDGTATLEIEGNIIEGAMSGNSFGFSVLIIEEEDLVECSANAILTGTISGGTATGNISGAGECELLTASTGFDVTGTASFTKS